MAEAGSRRGEAAGGAGGEGGAAGRPGLVGCFLVLYDTASGGYGVRGPFASYLQAERAGADYYEALIACVVGGCP